MATDPRSEATQGEASRFRALIAGGGVAAVEALLALQKLAGDRVAPHLFSPDPEFRFRPLSVTEPFGLAAPRNLDLLGVALEHNAAFLRDAVAEVDPDRRRVTTTAHRCLAYDALLIAIGARRVEAVPGALTFRDTADQGAFRSVLTALERGAARHLVFAVPCGTSWPLGLYELALLSSAHARQHALHGVELTLLTPEAHPLELFGRRASELIGGLLDQAGISLRLNTEPIRFEDGRLAVRRGEAIACDRVISLPSPEVGSLPGLPQDGKGFLPVDRHGGVLGVDRVFAAGDVTQFPVKQGGLAAQQADCAAGSIAALAGANVDPEPFRPVLRGALLTGWGPRYLRAPLGEATDAAAKSILWWPPAKVAGRHLASYLASRAGCRAPNGELADLEAPYGEDAADARSDHADVVSLALSFADTNARWRDFRGALRWLQVAEDLELYLPRSYELKRMSWSMNDNSTS